MKTIYTKEFERFPSIIFDPEYPEGTLNLQSSCTPFLPRGFATVKQTRLQLLELEITRRVRSVEDN